MFFSGEISHFQSFLGLPYFASETLSILCFPLKKLCLWGRKYVVATLLNWKPGDIFCIRTLHRARIFHLSLKSHRRHKMPVLTG